MRKTFIEFCQNLSDRQLHRVCGQLYGYKTTRMYRIAVSELYARKGGVQ